MPDPLLDALPVIDPLEITANTRAVARLTRRDQSSVSRIDRRASNRLGLCFGKDERGEYRDDERRTAELVRDHLLDLAVVTELDMETFGASLVALPMARQPILIAAPPEHPLHGPNPVDAQALTAWPLQSLLPATSSEQRCHLRGLGLTLQDGPHHHSLQSLSLVPAMALPARPHQGRLAALPFHTGLESVEVLLLHRDLHDEATLIQLAEAVVRLHRDAFARLETLQWLL